jgi:hypothetical protein
MAIIITRDTGATAKNSPLSNAELDNNFINLNGDIATRIPSAEKGAVNGIATLDGSGKVPATQLPSYVDDVVEAANLASFPATGETGKIYVAIDTNKTYRWSGSAYVYITSGAVDSVAGKTGIVTLAKADVGLANVDNTSDANKPVSTAQQTALDTKQATLVSGTNIKTVNGTSVLGSGNIQIDGGVTSFNTRTGAVTLSSGDVTGALGFTPLSNATSYLPLSGGTLSGGLIINASSGYPIQATSTGRYQIGIKNTSATAQTAGWWFVHDASGNLVFHADSSGDKASLSSAGALNAIGAITQNGNQVLHAGNYNNYALPLGGGTLTGTLVGRGGTGLSFNAGTSTASDYNYVLSANNDTGTKLVVFVNGSTRSADGGVNATVIRSDGGPLVLGSTLYNTNILGSNVTIPTNVHIGAGNTNPNGTAFSHTIAGLSSAPTRVVNFDGNGYLPSVWWTNGATALFAIDGTTNGALFWANSGGSWQQQMSVTYGTVNVNTALQQGGNQVLHAGNYTNYAVAKNGSSWTPHPSTARSAEFNTFYTDYGYIQFGPANASWAHIYSDKNFYFNQGIWINNYRVLDASNYNSYALPLSGGTMSGAINMVATQKITQAGFAGIEYHNNSSWEGYVGTENNTGNLRYNSRLGTHTWYSNGTSIASLTSGSFSIGSDTGGANLIQRAVGGWGDVVTVYRGGTNVWNLQDNAGNAKVTSGSFWIGSNLALHAGNYTSYSPSLTGSGASGTWGISVTGTAASISGFNNPTTAATANTIVYRDGSGDIYGNYMFAAHFNQSSSNSENPSIAAFWTNSGADNYNRKSTPAHVISQLGLLTTSNYSTTLQNNYMRAIGYASTSNDWNAIGNAFPNTVEQIDPTNFSSTSNGPVAASYTYGLLVNFSAQSSAQAQVYISHAGNDLIFRGGWNGNGWNTWNKVLTNQNYTSYSPSLTGSGASGTWGINVNGYAGSLTYTDTRSVETGPAINGGIRFDFKANTTDGLNDGGSYHGVMTYQQWSDSSGGGTRQLGFTDNNNLWIRGSGSGTTTYAAWKQILDSSSYVGYSTFSGKVISGGNNGFANDVYYSGVRNPIWSFGNSSSYGISYYQGSAGIGGSDTIGFSVNGTTVVASNNFAISPTNAYVNNNIVLHAGNYTNYFTELVWRETTPYAYDPVNSVRHYWIRIARLPDNGTCQIEIESKTDYNYSPFIKGIASFSGFNGTNVTAQFDLITPESISAYVAIDNNSDVWIRADSTWSSYLRWRFVYNNGVTVWESANWQQTLTTVPVTHVVLRPGQSIRTDRGNVTAVSPSASGTNVVGNLSVRGGATIAGNTAIHAGNYSSYALPLTGGTVTGTTRIGNLSIGSGTYLNSITPTGDTNLNLATPSGATYANNIFIDSNQVLHAANYTSYRPPLLNAINATSTSVSNWNPQSLTYQAWGQGFANSNISGDSGDIVYWLRASQYTGGGTELCVIIDGDYFAGTGANKVLHAGNYSSYALPLSGGTVTGQTYFQSNLGATSGATSGPPLQAYSTGNNSAFMSFHKGGYYAVNMGLDSDNVLRIGGWSAAASRWELDMSGNNWAASSFRAPIFYDSNDTSYYTDPNSGSRLANIFAGNVASSNDGGWNARMNLVGSSHARLDVVSNSDGIITTMYSHTGQGVGKVGMYSNHPLVLMAQGAVEGGSVYNGSLRSPIFYDSDDTGYYINPNSTSNSALKIRGGAEFGPNTDWGATLYVGGNGRVGTSATVAVTDGNIHIDSKNGNQLYLNWYNNENIYTGGGNLGVGTSSSVIHRLYVNGTGSATTDFRAPIFYDSDDTSYYINPNATSKFGSHIVGGHSGEAYNTASAGRLYIGTNADNAYSIYTAMENVGGNYTKLILDWHTGIKIGAYSNYGGTRFYNDAVNSGGTKIFSVGEGDGNVRAYGDIRAPIFYDLNNTTYYFDGAGTSLWNGSTQDSNHTFNNYGAGIIGTYSANRYQAVFAMGDGYKLPIDGANTGSLYGIAWSHPNAGGVAANLSTHGALILENGAYLAAISGSIRSRDDMRTPIFYDSNNTAFYLDPNSTGTSLNVAGAIVAAGNITAYSDERLKSNWKTLPKDFVENLAEVLSGTFTRTDNAQRQAGVGAQSLQKLLPEAVVGNGILSVAYGNAAMVSAVELAKRVVEQDARIAKLEALVAQLLAS